MRRHHPQPELSLDYPFVEQILIRVKEMLNPGNEAQLREKLQWSIFGIQGWCGAAVVGQMQFLYGETDI
jgi:hypothetical protein